jgi:pilus assembly protein CpaB
VSRRRRAFALLGLALLLGGLAASDVAGREEALERSLQPLVPVVVARTALPAGEPVAPGALTVRHVPARFAPRDALAAPAQAVGRRPAVPVAAGADVGVAVLHEDAEEAGPPVRRGERVAEVVAAGPPELVVPGARVDVLVTREARPGAAGRTEVALEDVEVVAAAPAADGAGAAEAPVAPRVSASLRVTLRQAVFLAAAQGFARELRLLPRPPGDRRRGAAGLGYDDGLAPSSSVR